jgi:hypothetical protein
MLVLELLLLLVLQLLLILVLELLVPELLLLLVLELLLLSRRSPSGDNCFPSGDNSPSNRVAAGSCRE